MIRPLDFETLRYGDASTMADSRWDHPFQWGSKRTGPDLAREGGRNPHAWHAQHFMDPRAVNPGSNMPAYAHFATEMVDLDRTADKMRALRSVGVPYAPRDIESARASATKQAEQIAAELREQGSPMPPGSEMVAMIAYLQSLGVAAATEPPPPAKPIAAR
jgi:cytochrome c oxidase cbb3-type subunit I/II